MPAPTALLKKPADDAAPLEFSQTPVDGDEDIIIDNVDTMGLPETGTIQPAASNPETEMDIDEELRPKFAPAKDEVVSQRRELRKVPIPPHRM
jgi:RNA-binding protein PNO1